MDESKVAKTYYVDAAAADAADDDKHGTQDSPFLTIKRAVDAAVRDKDANVGAKIVIGPGTYRESIDIPPPPGKAADTDAPLVIEAAERDQTIIDCADATGWEASTWKTDGTAKVHPWPFGKTNEQRPRNVPPADASGLVLLDGTVLRQVAAPAALVPGSFCIVPGTERKNPSATIRVRLPEDVDPESPGVFSIGVRNHGLLTTGRRNVVVRSLLFEHAAAPASATPPDPSPFGLGFIGCSNVLVEDVLSQWNDGLGLEIMGNNVRASANLDITLRRVRLIHDGESGLLLSTLKNVLVEDCETSFNHFRGEWRRSFDPQGPAGALAGSIHGSTWRRHRAVGNQSRGLWWKGDCTDLLVEDAVVQENFFSGLFIENCPGPSVIRGCLVADNKTPPGTKLEAAQPAAVSVEASPDVTLENNVFAGNTMPQLGLRDTAERTDGVNFETGAKTTLRAERHSYHHNAFWGSGAEQVLCDLPTVDRAGKAGFDFYYGTLDSDENCFWNPASEGAFAASEHKGARVRMPLAAWRSFLANQAGPNATVRPEAGSLWQDPLFMEPGEGDFRLQAQSPLIDWGLPSEEGGAAQ